VSGEEEKTETVYGVENTVSVSLQCFAQVKERHDSCGDDTLPSVIVSTEPIKNAYRELLRRGIKTRFITEITEKNIEYCKELMKIVYELRHLEGIKGNFGVSESDYIATSIQQEGRPIPQLIHSNARAMIEQQQYFFETLWDKAIPAKQRIREIEEGIPVEITEVVRGIENIVRNQVEGLSFTRFQHDACVDPTFPASLLSSKMVWDKCLELRNRGVKMRTITEITPKNIAYCKRMVERMELRHLEDIRGNFSISDKKTYRGTAAMREGKPPTEGIRSTTKVFVEQQQYFFETLWNKAIPAKQRIREIEKGAKREFVETFRDPSEIQKIGFNLIKKAEEEILILFSTPNALSSQEKAGTLELLKEAVLPPRNVKIRILVAADNKTNRMTTTTTDERIRQLKRFGIDVRISGQRQHQKNFLRNNNLALLIVDQSFCFNVELNDDTKEETSEEEEAIGLATYSNSDATVFAYLSIFENLWMRTQV
jgi:two-component system, OmpR family, sensor histidine kinase VicK